MSAYGHSFVNTPNFDWIANTGALFNNAFTTNPKCAPSRASILTGMHTWQLEEACGHIVCTFSDKFAVYPEILEESGYFVGYTGKGWAPGKWREGGRKYNPAGPCFNNRLSEPPKKTKLSNIDYAGNFAEFLEQNNGDKPFCFWYGGKEPHRHYVQGEGRRNGKKLEDIKKVPSYWPDNEIVRNDMLDYAFETEWFDTHLGKMISLLEENGLLDNTIIVATSDNGCPFPRVKGQMYEQDFRLPLAVSWPALGNGGRVVDDIISFTDFAPTFLEIAGLEKHPQMEGTSLLSLITSTESGLLDQERNVAYMGRECHDAGREGDKGYPVRCIRTAEYLYIRNFEPERWPAGNPETHFTNCDGSPTKDCIIEMQEQGNDYYYNLAFAKRPLEELYHISADPECLDNLVFKKEYKGIKTELWNNLKAKLEETNDPRIFGNGDVFDDYVSEDFAKLDNSWQAYLENRWKVPGFMDWKKYREHV
jgi:N-sulfoglucosamine sulfohydrolase